MTKGRPFLEIVSASQLSIQEARCEVLVESEKLLSKFKENGLDADCTIVFRVHLGKEFTAEQSDGVDELEVAVLSGDVILVVLFFFGEGSCIFFLLTLALLGEMSLLFF